MSKFNNLNLCDLGIGAGDGKTSLLPSWELNEEENRCQKFPLVFPSFFSLLEHFRLIINHNRALATLVSLLKMDGSAVSFKPVSVPNWCVTEFPPAAAAGWNKFRC